MNFNRFVDKESLNSLSWCIMATVSFTEIFKISFPLIDPRLFVIFFSLFISYARMCLSKNVDDKKLKENLLIVLLNVPPIALGSMGMYDVILKTIFKSFGLE